MYLTRGTLIRRSARQMIFAGSPPSSLLFIVFPSGYQSHFTVALPVEDDNLRGDTGDARNVNRECASGTRVTDFAGFASLTTERIWNRDCFFLFFPASSAAEVWPFSLSLFLFLSHTDVSRILHTRK